MRIVSALGVLVVAGLLSWFILTNEGPGAKYPTKLGLDLAGGTALVYKADTKDITGDKQGALNSLREVVDKRVNLFGVAEPLVQLEKSSAVAGEQEDRLIIELPGVTDVKAAVDAIGKTPVLEFKLVGQPVAEFLEREGAVVHRLTLDSVDMSPLRTADIVVSGAGSPHLITPEMVREGVMLIDAGTSESGGALVGDINPACEEKASVFTPVPGGVGPIAVACLFRNVVELLERPLQEAEKAVH